MPQIDKAAPAPSLTVLKRALKTPFVPIPAGWFLMGSTTGQADERPLHRVWVEAFEMAVYPVTRAQYKEFLQSSKHQPLPRDWHNPLFTSPDQPVVGVNWYDACAYCRWYSTPEGTVRLPTEAEWERAARGGHQAREYPWGDSIPDWVPMNENGPIQAPWTVSHGEPNDFGLYGIATNIHEWCADWYSGDFYATSPTFNPVGAPTGTRRASRGGAWRHAQTISRTAARSRLDPSFRYTDYGFRIVRTI